MFHKRLKIIILFCWVIALLCSGYFMFVNNVSINQLIEILGTWFNTINKSFFWLLPTLFVIIFVFRPIFLIPTWVMNVLAIVIFKPLLGYFLVLLAEQLSAGAFYFVIKYLSGEKLKEKVFKGIAKLNLDVEIAKEKKFFTVLALRLASFPFDFITALCAMIGIPFIPFMLATLLVSIPWAGLFFLTFSSFQEGSFISGVLNSIVFAVFISSSYFVVKKTGIIKIKKDLKL